LVGTNYKILKTLTAVTKQRSLNLNVRLEVTNLCELSSFSKAKQGSGMLLFTILKRKY
jgi:hypothetical protein